MPGIFELCFPVTLYEEDSSGLGKITHDDGGTTRWGIAQRYHPTVDVASLTLEGAKRIYKVEYWDALHCGELPGPFAMVVFDAAVNPGPSWAKKALQQVLGVVIDGRIGPKTIEAAERAAGADEISLYSDLRLSRFESSSSAPTNMRGWRRRVLRVQYQAARMSW